MSVHKSVAHESAMLHVTGRARYTDDIPMPANTMHLAFGTSPKAYAKIRSMDLKQVWASEGVLAVYLASDIEGANDVSPVAHDEPLLAEGIVYFVGQPIFLVVADTHLNARKAARKAQYEWEEFTPVLSIDEALEKGQEFENPQEFLIGEPEKALAASNNTISGEIEMGGQEHFYLEGQAASALPQENGDMLVHSSTQHPTEVQHKVAEVLGVSFADVRVETRRMGGGFGGKESQANVLACACALAASLTALPCRMRYDRDDDMMITGKRHDFRIAYQVGFDNVGKLSSVLMQHYARCGWAQDLSLAVVDRAMFHSDNAYYLPNARIKSHRLKTNTQSATAYRGFGGPQGALAIERIMDEIAHFLGCDPIEVRRVNYYKNGQKTPYYMTIQDSVIADLVDELVATSDYHKRRKEIEAERTEKPNAILRRGIALTPVKFGISFTLSQYNQAGALVHIYTDGSVHLNHAGTEMGQGLFLKVAQVAATALGIGLEDIKINAADTAKIPNTSATAASAGSDLNGMAVLDACNALKTRIEGVLQDKYDTQEKAVFKDDIIQIGKRSVPFKEAVLWAYQARVQLSATGFYATPKIKWNRKTGKGRPFYYFAYGAAVSEVVVDRLTGENRILRTDILHDAGKSLNPSIDIGQIEGGFVQGAGWLTTEELVWDQSGSLRTHAPSTYKIPACSDRPLEFNVDLFENENTEPTIYRSKAVGEPPFLLGMSVFFAISDAIGSSKKYPKLNAPATPERIFHTLNGAQDGL